MSVVSGHNSNGANLGRQQTPSIGTSPCRRLRLGFTLIEMMIVIVILIILLAIFQPVLRGARNAARTASTKQLVNNIQASAGAFELDQRRLPGAFTAAQMGSVENATRGFTNMQNMLLELSGGIIASGNASARRIQVGPSATNRVLVDLDLINAPSEVKGVTKNVYYTIDKKNWVSQNGANQKVAIAEHITLPDVVDAFSNPLLAWVEDEGATADDPFASIDSGTRSKFYWNSNAAFLRSGSLGAGARDQTDAVSGSMIAPPRGQAEIEFSMHGVLGHPAFPVASSMPNSQVFPASSRGKIVFHSAGIDGVYLGARDRGGLIATAPGNSNPFHRANVIDYRGSRNDPLDNFDDIISVGGN